ncbi:magnesium ion transporter [Rhodotorula mucilaginosa]|uniref:Magnesium transporter n=1 Tax=Rhodotorula mucilaginosa TaxID=5537 RepID=A0A9P6VSV2_RHOMI|nr:magnesium ion transporter [Rhodotorula mucilaginosa]TKA57954.1 hypothetical protein B0A53_00356 [Rhodotorula sp. CCFEE 5036]
MQRTAAARLLGGAIPTRLQQAVAAASPRPLRPHRLRPPAVPPLLQRWYQHTSKHAPNSGHGTDASRDEATNRSGIAYTRHELLADWHSYARKISPLDVQWKGKDQIEAQYLILKPDGSIEEPQEKLVKQDPRDLRSLDAHLLDVRPALIVCRRSMILCSPIVRAIIAHDQIVLVGSDRHNPICDPDEAKAMAEAVVKVMKYLEMTGSATAKDESPSFELRALEALLLLTVRGLKNVVTELQERVYRTVPQLRFGVSPAELRDLLECKRAVEDCLLSGRGMQSALALVLGEDEDLAGMYLTDKANGKVHNVEDHQQAELLLEYYERRLDETSESCERLRTLLEEVDSNISLVLASTRVRLQNLELQTAIGTLALGAGATIAAFFGMNLTSHLEEHPSAFYWCIGGTSTFMLGITAICWVRLVRARRSQLFLRNSLHPRKEEDQSLVRSTRAGPVGALTAQQGAGGGSNKSDVLDVDVHKAVEEQTGQIESSSEQDKKKKEKGGDHPMERKDGTTL